MKSKILIYFFWLCCITDIISNMVGFPILHSIAKPLLMPTLAVLLLVETNFSTDKSAVLALAGLFFGWLGDVLLMFENIRPIFFILGLVGFLCGHLCYIFYFKNIATGVKKASKRSLLFLVPVVLYVTALLYLLYPSLGPLKIPVTVYAIVLAAMLCVALWLQYKIYKRIALFFISGAAFFVLSDSVLAINKFYHSFSLAGFVIMSSYCLAQYLIVRGAIKVYQGKSAVSEAKV